MSSIAKCAHCGREVGDAGPDASEQASCPFCGQPVTGQPVAASLAAGVVPAAPAQTAANGPAVPGVADRAIPVAVARLGGSAENHGSPSPVARIAPAPAETGADPVAVDRPTPVVARAVAPGVAPMVARVATPVVASPVVARAVPPLVPMASLAGESNPPADVPRDLPAAANPFLGQAGNAAPATGLAGQFDAPAPQAPSQEPIASPPWLVDPAGESQPLHDYQRVMGELDVSADVFGTHAQAAAPLVGESTGSTDQGNPQLPWQAESPIAVPSVSQEAGPTPDEIAQAREAEIARAREAELAEMARIQEAMRPFALTTASLADKAVDAAALLPEAVGESREIAGEAIEEPVAGIEVTVGEADASTETQTEAMEPLTASTEVLAAEAVGEAADAIAVFETREPLDPLPEPLARCEGVAAAEVAVPVCPTGPGSVLPEGAVSAGETGGEGTMFGFTPLRAGAAVAPVARAEGVAQRLPARPSRRRKSGGGIAGLVGVMLSGLLGMFLVYYAFNWLGGPRYDFFKFPLPGLRHTYKHLIRYPSLPRFGIDPDAPVATSAKNGRSAEATNGSEKEVESTQALEPAEEAELAKPAKPARKNGAAKKGAGTNKAAQSGKPQGAPTKKAADDAEPFDMPMPDFSPAAPAAKKTAEPAKSKSGPAKKAEPPAKSKGGPAKKAADDDAPFDMPVADPAESLPMPNLTPPGSP